MVHRSSLVAVIVALALCHASPAYPKCARVLLAPQLITHAADPIPAGGGVLIGFTETTDDSAETFAGHDPAMNADWTLVVGKRKTRPRLEQLAPGLAVYRPGALRGTRPTQVVLRDGKGAKVGAFSASSRADAASLPAPSVKRVTSTAVAQDKGRWRGTVTTTVVRGGQEPRPAGEVNSDFDNPANVGHLPRPFGIFYANSARPTYEDMMTEQLNAALGKGVPDLDKLLRGSEIWEIK